MTNKVQLQHPHVGELWSCTAIRVRNTLQIEQAAILENIASGATDSSGTALLEKDPSTKQSLSRVVLPDPTAPIQEALKALVLETRIPDWELSSVQRRAEVWEWEAVNLRLEPQARVQYGSVKLHSNRLFSVSPNRRNEGTSLPFHLSSH